MEKKEKCILTGATGHVGYAVLMELLAQGEDVTILLRKPNALFDGLDCKVVLGDVTDYASLEAAFRGMDVVYHVAGAVEINKGKEDRTWIVNYEGTINVLKACHANKVRRLVYMSSVDALRPLPDGEVMVEQTHFDPSALIGTYAKTKAAATQYLLDNHGDTELVVLHPSACTGPYDFKGSSLGEGVRMFMSGKYPVTMTFGAYNFVDVRDVAKATRAAATRGRNGECYIISGEYMTVDAFIRTLNQINGNRAPIFSMSERFVKCIAPIMEVYYGISGATPLFTRYTIKKLKDNCNFSYEKAARDLGYAPMSAAQSLADTVAWIKEHA
ncbi:MAG: NAD-dependent epimerase/dehydratase family protein [Clostridia bacterium]|nr:NAD-dependent epimerase/dehydratase family protein [Clostridia bacterium]